MTAGSSDIDVGTFGFLFYRKRNLFIFKAVRERIQGMNYIVLDLEWNQCPDGKGKENKNLPFEIIEIGAVKLDADRQYVDSFHKLIAPQVYHTLHFVTKELINVTMNDLKNGDNYEDAIKEFIEWCGEDFMFCTWGSMDLTELQRNNKFYNIPYKFPYPFFYYDLQKSYSLCYDDGRSRVSLETAIEAMGIEKEDSFHSAYNDAKYTAKIMTAMEFNKVKIYTSVDTFIIPRTRKEEISINYGTYGKFISKGYEDKDDLIKDSYIFSAKCFLCGQNTKKKIKWFSGNQKSYYCAVRCELHGLIRGRLKIKKSDDNKLYAVKVLKLTDEEGIGTIKQKQIAAREHRRERRKKEKEKNANV
jgi:inhibitor of KinA sporulation pathway (predicted exonuclease)